MISWSWRRVVKLSERLWRKDLSLGWVVSNWVRAGPWWPGEASFHPRMLGPSTCSASRQIDEHFTQGIFTLAGNPVIFTSSHELKGRQGHRVGFALGTSLCCLVLNTQYKEGAPLRIWFFSTL